jgi:hypothetical protein
MYDFYFAFKVEMLGLIRWMVVDVGRGGGEEGAIDAGSVVNMIICQLLISIPLQDISLQLGAPV